MPPNSVEALAAAGGEDRASAGQHTGDDEAGAEKRQTWLRHCGHRVDGSVESAEIHPGIFCVINSQVEGIAIAGRRSADDLAECGRVGLPAEYNPIRYLADYPGYAERGREGVVSRV